MEMTEGAPSLHFYGRILTLRPPLVSQYGGRIQTAASMGPEGWRREWQDIASGRHGAHRSLLAQSRGLAAEARDGCRVGQSDGDALQKKNRDNIILRVDRTRVETKAVVDQRRDVGYFRCDRTCLELEAHDRQRFGAFVLFFRRFGNFRIFVFL